MSLTKFAPAHHHAYTKGFEMVADSLPEGYVAIDGGVTSVVTHSTIPLFNQIIITDDSATEHALESSVAVMGGTGLRFAVSLRAETDARFVPLLEQSGLVSGDTAPAMMMRPIVGHEMPEELEIRSGPEAFDDHIQAASKGFGMPREILDAVLVPQLADRDDLTVYAGYLDDEPVTCSLGFIDDGSISVFNVATLEEYRGNGYGAAMTMKAVLDSMERGCDVAFLQATEMGFPLYERLGFETIFTYKLWGLPPAS